MKLLFSTFVIVFVTTLSWNHAQSSFCTACVEPKNLSRLVASVNEMQSLISPNRDLHHIDSPACSHVAQQARQSVKMMVLPSGERESLKQLVGRDDLSTRKEIIRRITANKMPPPSQNDITIWEIQQCINNNADECFIHTEHSVSTVNVVAAGNSLVTALHNVRRIFKPIIESGLDRQMPSDQIIEQLMAVRIPAFIYDHQGGLVADPTDFSLNMERIDRTRIRHALRNLANGQISAVDDFVYLRTSRSLATAVSIASTMQTLGSRITAVAFGPTAVNSEGEPYNFHLLCSVGQILSPEQVERLSGWGFSRLSPEWQNLFRRYAILSNMDALPGMSGGAVFNTSGEVIGVHTGGGDLSSQRASASRAVSIIAR